jgi:glutathione S-transferase
MIELVQFPWSPYCLVQRRILEFSGVSFKTINIPSQDRTLVWQLTKERYYGVPVIKDNRNVLFETGDESQVIAKYLDSKLQLGLFPADIEGVQFILWRYIEDEVEGCTFRLNDAYYKENMPPSDQLPYLRFKERKFGRGCLEQWLEKKDEWLQRLEQYLVPFEEMLMHKPFLLGESPRFVDFDLWGMLANFLYTRHYQLPERHPQIQKWYRYMTELKQKNLK